MLLLRSVPSVALMPSHGSVFVPIVLLPSFVALHVYIPGLWAPLSSTESHPSPLCVLQSLRVCVPEASSTSAADRDRHGFTKWPSFTRSSKILRLETIRYCGP
jgi:hypothetical protein